MRAEAPRHSASAAARGALWITLIALVTTSVALSLQYAQTTRLLAAQSRALVQDEAASLVERYESAGVRGLAAFLERQQRLPRINEFFYLLATPTGAPLVGNLVAWPSEIP